MQQWSLNFWEKSHNNISRSCWKTAWWQSGKLLFVPESIKNGTRLSFVLFSLLFYYCNSLLAKVACAWQPSQPERSHRVSSSWNPATEWPEKGRNSLSIMKSSSWVKSVLTLNACAGCSMRLTAFVSSSMTSPSWHKRNGDYWCRLNRTKLPQNVQMSGSKNFRTSLVIFCAKWTLT